MGEVLLAFTIITLTFIVFYLKREIMKKKDSLEIADKKNIILSTPINNRKSQTITNQNENFFNGTKNLNNQQLSEISSPFVASNPSYIKIKNINYNNINNVSPINNQSYVKNNNYLNSFQKTPCKDDQKNHSFLKNNTSDDDYNTFENKIKNINLAKHSEFSNNAISINKDEASYNKHEKFERVY